MDYLKQLCFLIGLSWRQNFCFNTNCPERRLHWKLGMKQSHSWPVISSAHPWPHMPHTKVHTHAAGHTLCYKSLASCLVSPSFVSSLDTNLRNDSWSWPPPSPGWSQVAPDDERELLTFLPNNTKSLKISLRFLKTVQGESVILSKSIKATDKHVFFPQRAHFDAFPRAPLDITLCLRHARENSPWLNC